MYLKVFKIHLENLLLNSGSFLVVYIKMSVIGAVTTVKGAVVIAQIKNSKYHLLLPLPISYVYYVTCRG